MIPLKFVRRRSAADVSPLLARNLRQRWWHWSRLVQQQDGRERIDQIL
jgi:hypothetical protein